MSLTPIKTIFWDIGGVLLTNGWDSRPAARVLTALGVDLAAYEAVHDEVNYYWERGLMSARDFFEQTVIATNPQLNLTFEQLWPLVCGESKVLHPECFDILAALKRLRPIPSRYPQQRVQRAERSPSRHLPASSLL